MNIETSMEIEKRITKKLVESLIAQGLYVSIYDGENIACQITQDANAAHAALGACDEEWVRVSVRNDSTEPDAKPFKRLGNIFLVYGNDGYDVIADYSVSLEAYLKDVNEYAEQQEELYA